MPVGGQGKNVSIYQQIEATEATKPTGNYRKLPVKSFTLAPDENLQSEVVLSSPSGNRDPMDPYRDFIDLVGEAVIPLDLTNIGHWLRMLFGAPATTNVSADYTHVFKSGSNTMPSAAFEKVYSDIAGANEGYLGVRANTLNLPIQANGAADATIGLIGMAHTPNLTSAPGTPTTATFERFNRFQGAVQRNGAALGAFMQGTLTFGNDMEAVKAVRADRRIEGVDWGETQAGFDGTVRLTAANASILTDAIAGTVCSLSYSMTISAVKSLLLELPRVTLRPRGPGLSGPKGIDLPVTGIASYDNTVGAMVRVTLKNQTTAY